MVPKCYAHSKSARWLDNMKYKHAQSDTGTETYEHPEPYLERLQGYILYFASITQSSVQGNPLGCDKAWEYVARLAPNHSKADGKAICSDYYARSHAHAHVWSVAKLLYILT